MEIGNEVNGGFIDFGGAGRGQGDTPDPLARFVALV